MGDEDNVISIETARDADGLPLAPAGKRPHCIHRCVLVDEHSRTMKCKQCGASINPFDHCVRFAREWEVLGRTVKNLSAKKVVLLKDLDDLDRQIRNAKARVRRAKKQAAE